MALIKPISGFPNNNTIDISNGSTFYTVIQGAGSVVIGYVCNIYSTDTYELIYTTNKVNLTSPMTAGDVLEVEIPPTGGVENGKSYYWTIRLYQKKADMFVASSTVQEDSTESFIRIRAQSSIKNGMELKIEGVQRKISYYDISTGAAGIDYPFPIIPSPGIRCEIYSDFVESISFPFKTSQTPTVTIRWGGKTGQSRNGIFYGSFDATISVQIQWYKVIIYDHALNIFHDSGKIFSSAMEYEYPNLTNQETYYIQFIVQTIDDIFIESEMKELRVVYDTFIMNTDVAATANCDSTITLEWKDDRIADGVATGNYSFIYMGIQTILGMTTTGIALPQRYYAWLESVDNVATTWNDVMRWTESLAYTEPAKRLQILSGTVDYNQANGVPLVIDFSNFTIMTDVFIPAGQQGKILSVLNTDGKELFLKCENGKLIYSIGGVVKTTLSITTSELRRYKISLTPSKAVINQVSVQ